MLGGRRLEEKDPADSSRRMTVAEGEEEVVEAVGWTGWPIRSKQREH